MNTECFTRGGSGVVLCVSSQVRTCSTAFSCWAPDLRPPISAWVPKGVVRLGRPLLVKVRRLFTLWASRPHRASTSVPARSFSRNAAYANVRSRCLPLVSVSTPRLSKSCTALPAVGLVVLSNLTTVGMVTTGCIGSCSINRTAMTDAPGAATRRRRSAVISANTSQAAAMASSAIVAMPSKKKAHPRFPVATSPYFTEQAVVLSPVALEEETQIEQRRGQ